MGGLLHLDGTSVDGKSLASNEIYDTGSTARGLFLLESLTIGASAAYQLGYSSDDASVMTPATKIFKTGKPKEMDTSCIYVYRGSHGTIEIVNKYSTEQNVRYHIYPL